MATVMLVTNELHGAHELEAVLRNSQHRVLTESDGRAALRAMENAAVDVLATDAVLPDMLGTDLIVMARMHLDRPTLPAVLLSGVPRGLMDDLVEDVTVPVLPMPLSGAQLVDTIARLHLPLSPDPRHSQASELADAGQDAKTARRQPSRGTTLRSGEG